MIDLEENIALGNDSVETLASLKALLNDLSVEDLQSISDAVDNHKELIADQQEQRELQKQLEQQEINEKEEKKNDIQQELERKTKVNELIKEYRGNKDFQNDPVISKLFETTIIVSRKTTPDELVAFEDAMDNKLE
jgi:DNA-binding transcriptional MerR regulator